MTINKNQFYFVKGKSEYLKNKYGCYNPIADIVGTDKEVLNDHWKNINGNLTVELFRQRIKAENLNTEEQVYCVSINNHSELLIESEIGEPSKGKIVDFQNKLDEEKKPFLLNMSELFLKYAGYGMYIIFGLMLYHAFFNVKEVYFLFNTIILFYLFTISRSQLDLVRLIKSYTRLNNYLRHEHIKRSLEKELHRELTRNENFFVHVMLTELKFLNQNKV